MPAVRTILAGDIGATKTALALFEAIAGSPLRLAKQATFVSRDYPSLEAILGEFTPNPGPTVVERACFGVAGPVEHGIAHLTNLPWVVDEHALATSLRTPSVSVINDLQAAAYGMLFVDPTKFAVLHAGPAAPDHATLAVIAPGTGLGEALLFWDGERYHAVASEGGHADFAPETDQEIELLRWLRQRFGHVSYERILSGDGIANVYAFLRKGDSEPAWLAERLAHGDRNASITEVALAGQDRVCVEALDMFCAILGAEASNLALKGLATGGVIIAGGIAPKILPALERGGLIARFTDKGRFSDWVGKLGLRVALDPRAPLLGAANWTSHHPNAWRRHDGSGRFAMNQLANQRPTKIGAERVMSDDELRAIDAYWRACNYLALGMLYLRDNPLLREPLAVEHIKRRLVGHWGSDPGQSFVWVHLNRLIKKYDLSALYIAGPGHGAPATLANSYLEGRYSEVYPDKSETIEGLREFFKQFSFPGGIGSHCTPETPGSIHEGGELGYSVSHAFGAAFDNPDLLVAVVIGDGEAETGPLMGSLHSNKFLDPIRDGAVLPILHLNGYKIANPTISARISPEELHSLFVGFGWTPYLVEGDEPADMHRKMAAALEDCVDRIRAIQADARRSGNALRPPWPMIILRTPKGWTAPEELDGHRLEGSWRAHQIPIPDIVENPAHLKLLEAWMRGYRPEELFDAQGRLVPELRALAPTGTRRISANPHANGGLLRIPLRLPDLRTYAVPVTTPAVSRAPATHVLGQFLRDVMRDNMGNFRVFGPDETSSNRLQAIYEASKKTWLAGYRPEDADGGELAPDGRVMEMLSEHTLEGWAEGYVLTGRHALFASYEAFFHIIDSMVNQHAKWLEKCKTEVKWRAPIPSLNLLVTSTVWRQDHNGFTHQDPGFLDVVTNKSAEVTRIYLPPDANCLLSVADHCLRSVDYVNVIVADKQLHLQYLEIEAAVRHCEEGIGIWPWASSDRGVEPDVVIASAGDVVTAEALAATAILREQIPDLKIRFVNVVDLFKLEPATEHPHGLTDRDFDSLFTTNKPVIFAFHGYPALIHKLAYRRTNHENMHVRGYKEKGSINTPLSLVILNQVDRFSLAIDVIDRVPRLKNSGAHVKGWLQDQILENLAYAREHGIDKPEIQDWKWTP